jgi:hypothetical protein
MTMLTPPGSTGGRFSRGRRTPRPVRFHTARRLRRRRVMLSVGAVLLTVLFAWGGTQLYGVFSGDAAVARERAAACAADQRRAERRTAAERARAERIAAERTAARHRTGGETTRSAAAGTAGLPAPKTITVRVFNSTKTGGLAKKTADALKQRGFQIAEFGNAPPALDGKVKEPARLITGAAGRTAARVLAAHLALPEADRDSPDAASARKPDRLIVRDNRAGTTVDLVIGEGWKSLSAEPAALRALAAQQRTPESKPSSPARPAAAGSPAAKGC